MSLYNTSWFNTTTSQVDILSGIGSSIGQPYLFGYLLLTVFFTILLFKWKAQSSENIAVAGFISTLMAILLYFVGLVDIAGIVAPALIFFFGLIYTFIS
jgi:hypothetical protein